MPAIKKGTTEQHPHAQEPSSKDLTGPAPSGMTYRGAVRFAPDGWCVSGCALRSIRVGAVGGIAPSELAAIGGRLEAFAEDIFQSLPRTDQRARGACYLRGLMLDGRRKSVEPMAQRLGEVHYQALHHFVAVSPWDWRPVRRRLAERLVAALGPTAWAVDDTGFPKDGTCSVGVQRQYSGTLGKTANCQLGVSVNAVTEHASCPLDWRLFLPDRWDEDAMASRRAACHLPEQVHHRPKWQLVLDMLDELAGFKLHPPVLLADSGYGEVGEFRGGLDARQIPYVVEVRSDTSAYCYRRDWLRTETKGTAALIWDGLVGAGRMRAS